MKKTTIILSLLCLFQLGFAQIHEPVKWKFSMENVEKGVVDIIATATVETGWKTYGTSIPEGGPVKTSFGVLTEGAEMVGSVVELTPSKAGFDEIFEMDINYFKGEIKLKQRFKLPENEEVISGYIEFMACDNKQCLPPTEVEFSFNINEGAAVAIQQEEVSTEGLPIWHSAPKETNVVFASEEDDTQGASLWGTFLLAFLGGFAALLTPCVFPMIPFTVSFFTKQSANRSQGIKNGILYGISIVFIYVILGTGIVAIFGAGSLNALSTNFWMNIFFFLLLIVFGASFLGGFEIMLPSSWTNASSQGENKGGIIGIFFMAFTLALVSFSCTGPIVGALLVAAASTGSVVAPAIGMFGFGLALALPFALFAAFPGWLNSLPKSGGWMNSVKVVLGFIELALAFKFLSIADMVLDLHILERELFIASWVVITALLALYLFGLLRMPHDSPNAKPGILSISLGVLFFAFAAYMVPALWGSSAHLISGFPPPVNYSESPFGFDAHSIQMSTVSMVVIVVILAVLLLASLRLLHFIGGKAVKSRPISIKGVFGSIIMLTFFFYMLPVFSGAPIRLVSWAVPGFEIKDSDKSSFADEHMHDGPQGIPSFYEYEHALAYAKKVNKPLLLDFTGVGCVNCRKVEETVWSDSEIKRILSEDYILVSMYVDKKHELPQDRQYVSPTGKKKVKTVGALWTDFQATRFKANAQPYYVMVDYDRNYFGTVKTMDSDVERYKKWLLDGLELYKNR